MVFERYKSKTAVRLTIALKWATLSNVCNHDRVAVRPPSHWLAVQQSAFDFNIIFFDETLP